MDNDGVGWALSRRLKVSESPPEDVRRRFLEQAFEENLAKASGPDHKYLEELREEAMTTGSKWLRYRKSEGLPMSVSDFDRARRLRSKA